MEKLAHLHEHQHPVHWQSARLGRMTGELTWEWCQPKRRPCLPDQLPSPAQPPLPSFRLAASQQPPKHTHRRVTFSTTNPVQDLQDASQHSYYDSGLEESETPSSKSSSGPRIGPLTLPEDHYERTTPDGSIGETEHPENGTLTIPSTLSCAP
ncbi:hypothetical protein JOQ06_018743 [Pogonophryne albipinna]|uniref:Uncharacterized protein n=1 Tax=Pogonophryne albipinna TaxID=1090488 RepID=A0AAD6ARN5_9TELE|nr:hypothetical protein JOQ06_018743 [Pogonophryne albipinna]